MGDVMVQNISTSEQHAPTPVVQRVPLPSLHYCCFRGDLSGVLECITEGHSIHETISMRNKKDQIVNGITPLFLAAQKGHNKVCKLLVENGANPNQPSYINGTTDLCTPAEVAQLNMHLLLARYLRKAVKQRRKEDAVLAQDEEDADRGRAGLPTTGFMEDVGDLGGWDPTAAGVPVNLDGEKVSKLMKKQKLDLYSWKPEDELARESQRSQRGGSHLNASKSRVVTDLSELEQVEVLDNGKMLNTFLKDLDLQAWDPEDQGSLMRPSQPLSHISHRSVRSQQPRQRPSEGGANSEGEGSRAAASPVRSRKAASPVRPRLSLASVFRKGKPAAKEAGSSDEGEEVALEVSTSRVARPEDDPEV